MQDEITHGDITLNPETMRVTRDGKDIHLGPKEYQLLALLIERPGAFSRAINCSTKFGDTAFMSKTARLMCI